MTETTGKPELFPSAMNTCNLNAGVLNPGESCICGDFETGTVAVTIGAGGSITVMLGGFIRLGPGDVVRAREGGGFIIDFAADGDAR